LADGSAIGGDLVAVKVNDDQRLRRTQELFT
jgi:hypothetical protein